jgi:hypothetical protein
MGGSPTPQYQAPQQVPIYSPAKPDPTLDIARINMQREGGLRALQMQTRLAKQMSQMPVETWTPDIFGSQGALTQAGQIAAINSFKSREAEKQNNPEAAEARRAIYQSALEDVQPNAWEKRMENWARTKGLQNYLTRGSEGSFGQEAFGEEASAEGEAVRNARLARAQQIIGQQPSVGIDPAQAVAALQGAQAQAMQQRAGIRERGFGLAQGMGQSASDFINQMMGTTSQGVAANQSEWRNYQNAMMQQSAQNYAIKAQQAANEQAQAAAQAANAQANQNALLSAGIGAAGTIAGTALAGPLGGALVGGLTSAGTKAAVGGGGARTPSVMDNTGFGQMANPAAQYYSNPFSGGGFSYFGTTR